MRRNRLPSYETRGIPCERPPKVLRASVYYRGQRLIHSGVAEILPHTPSHVDPFKEFLKGDTEIGWGLHKLQVYNSYAVAESLRDTSLIAK